jgi:predicted amidophosphoribosyltransferase
VTQGAEAEPSGVSIRCARCGAALEEETLRCPRCGADLAQQDAAIYRPRMGPVWRAVAWGVLAGMLACVIGAIVFALQR